MVPGPEERGPKTLDTKEHEPHNQREEEVTGEGNPHLRAKTTVPTDGLKPVVPEPKGKDPKTLKGKDEPELFTRSRWRKWHQDIDSRTRQKDVVEERSTGLPNRNNKGPQGPQGPWFGRLRRQGPPTTAHNGREGHYGAKSQPGQEFRPGRPNLNPSKGENQPLPDLRKQDQATEGPRD